jgi:hypothetical protein
MVQNLIGDAEAASGPRTYLANLCSGPSVLFSGLGREMSLEVMNDPLLCVVGN